MTSTSTSRASCRIVVGMKVTSEIEPPVEAATTLASAIEAEILGLFVEEEAMIDLAGLPFARAFDTGSAEPRQLTRDAMAQAISRGAQLCQRVLSTRAEKARVKWAFSSTQGDLPEALKSHLSAGDFLVVSAERRGFGWRQLISELRATPRHTRGVVIAAADREKPAQGPVLAIDDGDEAGRITVALAARIAAVTGAPMELFVVAASDSEAARIIGRAEEIAGSARSITTHRLMPGTPPHRCGRAHAHPAVFRGGRSRGRTVP